MYTISTLRSTDHGSHERGEWWRDQVSSIHCPMSFDIPDDYRGRLEHQRSESYQLVQWWGDAENISRAQQQIRTTPHGAYELLLPVRGSLTLRQGDRISRVDPTRMALTSLDHPLDLHHDGNFSSIALVVPCERLDARLPRLPQTGAILDAASGLGRILVDLITTVRTNGAALAGHQFDAVCDRILDLLALTHNGDTTAPSVDVHEDLVASIRRFVRDNAHDPALNGAAIAARLGWSLRNIQVHLQRAGTTPSDLIREERLALARLRLQDPAWARHSITRVAYSSGFSDLSTFSNAYRRRFGDRPSDARL